jgi:rRNA biogenesis protein RRP5
MQTDYPEGKYVNCRVLGGLNGMVELSLRESRLKGNMDDDRIPNSNETSTAYVVATTSKGCFVRLSRSVEGRVILKELSDDFVPNPATMFPPGRLIVGKVKNVKESQNIKKGNKNVTMVDMDLRESVLLASGNRITMDDVQENSKYTGVITRVESYGVFVRIDNSDVSGLAHVSECSDNYIKNIYDLYNPGDFVKLIVLSMDKEQRRLAFSLKASNFVDDDSEDDSGSSSASETNSDDSDDSDEDSEREEEDLMNSEDEDFASKLAKRLHDDEEGMDVDESTDADDNTGESSSDSESSDDEGDVLEEEPEGNGESFGAMDTNVGFDWGANTSKPTKSSKFGDNSSDDDESSDSSEDESEDDANIGVKSSHKARKKAATKKREEEETSRREAALADGTADESPENSADFERLVASSPNSSEVWIKYMAFHLSLADIDSARNVANRAFERIEFRQEGEKVSSSLLYCAVSYFSIVQCV